jgi:hypothetical protein
MLGGATMTQPTRFNLFVPKLMFGSSEDATVRECRARAGP